MGVTEQAGDIVIVRREVAVEVPWRNGGGTTREYCRVGGDDFDWRLSVAQIAQPGPFSEFPGVDRILVLLTGDGVTLQFGTGEATTLSRPLQLVRFTGETAVHAAPLGGPSTDLNLMWRRDRFTATVEIVDHPTPAQLGGDGTNLAYVVSGTLRVGDEELAAGDVVRWNGTLEVGETDTDALLVHFTLLPR